MIFTEYIAVKIRDFIRFWVNTQCCKILTISVYTPCYFYISHAFIKGIFILEHAAIFCYKKKYKYFMICLYF